MRSNVNVAIEPKVYHNEIKINDFCWSKNKNLKKKKNEHNKNKENKILPSLMILYCSTNLTSFRILLKEIETNI